MIQKINYADKQTGGKFSASDANVIKSTVNLNADVLSENSQSILSLQGGQLGPIKPTDAAPTPARNGNYTFSIGGAKPAWLTAESGVTTVKAGDGVAVVYTAPSSYSYTHVDMDSAFVTIQELNDLGYLYKGIATPTTDPGTSDGSVFYLASQSGIYSNFGGYNHTGDNVVLFSNASGSWAVTDLDIASSSKVNTIDKIAYKALTQFFSKFAFPGDEITNVKSSNFTQGGYYMADGSIGVIGGNIYSYQTDYVKVEQNTPYKYTGHLQDERYIVFYNKNKEVIGSSHISGVDLEWNFTTPSGCEFIRCSCTTSYLNNFKVQYNGSELMQLYGSKVDVQNLVDKQILVDELVTSSPSITTGSFLDPSGVITALGGSYYTNFIPVKSKIAYLIKCNSTDSRSICIYDSSNNFIEGWSGTELGSSLLISGGYYKAVLFMPTNAAYIRISGEDGSKLPSVWRLSLNSYQLRKQLDAINTSISGINTSISGISSDIIKLYYLTGLAYSETLLPTVSYTPSGNYFIDAYGVQVVGFPGDKATDYIPVLSNTKYRYDGNFADSRGYSEYDENNNFIRGFSADTLGINPCTTLFFTTHPNTRFVRFSVFNVATYTVKSVTKNLMDYINDILVNVPTNTTDYTTLIPEHIFQTDNDSIETFGREYLVRLYPESLIKEKVPVLLNDQRSIAIQKTVKNTNVKETSLVPYKLSYPGYLTKSGNINLVRTKSSNAKSKTMRLLCIGDSITALNLSYPDGSFIGGWGFPSLAQEIIMKDNIDHTGSLIKMVSVGRLNYESGRSFDYNGSNYPLRAFSEGLGSRTAASFLRHATHLTANGSSYHTPEAAWQMLGLKTITGHEFTGSNSDKNLIMTTVQKDNWDYGSAIYADMVGSDTYTGSPSQLAAIDTAMNNLLSNPDIPFYDLTTANSGVGYSFNLLTYLNRYKTLNDSDGTTRLLVGSTAGSKVTDANAYDVCTPTHVVIELGENDRWWYAPTASDIRNSLEVIATAIHATHPNVLIGFINTRMLGSYYPDRWKDMGLFQEMSQGSNAIKFDVQNLLKTDLGTLSNQVTNKTFLLPAYHTMSINSFSINRNVIDLLDGATKQVGNSDINHPGIIASLDVANQIVSWIYYTI